MNKTQGMNKTPGSGISREIPVASMITILVWFALILLQYRSFFPTAGFPRTL
jgi:hypothetical protein